MSGELYFCEMMGAGAALVDYDGDGDLDVYLVQGHLLGRERRVEEATFPPRHPLPASDRLYRNDLRIASDGTRSVRFVDVTESSGLAAIATGYGMGIATGDIDNDGWIDLYVTNWGPNQMLRNRGDGTFADVTAQSGTGEDRWSVPATFLDFDRDGWLDLFVGNYVEYRLAIHKDCVSESGIRDYCGPLAFRPETDRLYRNRGDASFEDVSAKAGILDAAGPALGAVAHDFDGDGWSDLYVANDQTPNVLWTNRGDGTFDNTAALAGCAVNEKGQPEASMGVVAGDLDGNGTTDLFMTHLTRETNTLYLNEGEGLFLDATRSSGLGRPSWTFTGFGTALIDYDGDGWLDVFVANGAVQRIEELMAKGDSYPLHQTNQLFRNLGNGSFEDITARAGEVFTVSQVSRGVAEGDVDNDGDSDLLVSNNSGPANLLVNEAEPAGQWLGLRVLGGSPAREVPGVRIAVRLGDGAVLWRTASTGGSYASARDGRILVGIAAGRTVESVEVFWPGGGKTVVRAPRLGRYLSLAGGVAGGGARAR
jgi:hypothetical protein